MEFSDSGSVVGITRKSAAADARSVRAAVGRTAICCAVALLVFSCAVKPCVVKIIPTPDPPVRTGLPLDLRVSVEPGRVTGFNASSVAAAIVKNLETVFSPDGHAHPSEGEASVSVISLQASEREGIASTLVRTAGLASGAVGYALMLTLASPGPALVLDGSALALLGATFVIADKSGQASAYVELAIRKPDGTVVRRYYGNGETRVSGRRHSFSAKSLAGDALADALDVVVQKLVRDRDGIAAELKR